MQIPDPGKCLCFLAGFWLLFSTATVSAQDLPEKPCPAGTIPRFEDYPSKPEELKKRATLKINNDFSETFPTRLKEALRGDPVNLAGHYILLSFGCGSGCLYGGIVDVNTGQATRLPFTLGFFRDIQREEAIVTRADSRLVSVRGAIKTMQEPLMDRFFEWDGKQLKPVCYVLLKEEADNGGK